MRRRAALLATLRRSVSDPRVLEAIATVPRERFVPHSLRRRAWENVALPIACEQTISQPLVVARMLQLLELTGAERVLDVGTGSGYHAALLATLTAEVVSIERHASLSAAAAAALRSAGIANVELRVGDGGLGAADRAPFDAINLAAATSGEVPPALCHQLAPGGRLVAPVAPDPAHPEQQLLVVLRRVGSRLEARGLEPVRFVPLVPGVPGPGRADAA
jgi:protein-L-isoaspartate(D-aspartate) O-methyltransferase